ncbi:hypothetical protein [Actinoplanes sp. NPDC051859]|uniref:hypothetical protein n=1 Tax=Actinoplanes sp. NPDC051859 TaxID=3363909 RepID=UPI0037A8E8E5
MLDDGVDWAALARGDGDPGLLIEPLRSPVPEVRRAAVEVVVARCRLSRAAPAALVPMLEPLVRDPRAGAEAVATLRRCGRASARFAAFLAGAAAAAPDPGMRRQAVETLMLVGDPRWVDPVVREGAELLPHPLMPVPCTPDVFDAVRRALPRNGVLCEVVARWGAAAAEAAPQVLGVLPYTPEVATRALLAVGHLAAPMVPELRLAAGRPGGLLAATALFRLTGDPAPALRALLTARPPAPPGVVALLGPLARSLVPEFELLLTSEAAATAPQCAAQLLAAQVVIAATGDTTAALPTVRAVLTAGGHRASMAVAVLADLAAYGYGAPERTVARGPAGGGWRGEIAGWKPELRSLLSDPLAGVGAAGLLRRLGEPADDLVPVAVRAIEDGRRTAAAITLLDELGAAAEAARLADSDARLSTGSADDDLVSTDELQRDRLLAIATREEPVPSSDSRPAARGGGVRRRP